MKSITLALDDEVYHRARMKAAEMKTSVSTLVRQYLVSLGTSETDVERSKREERELRDRIASFSAADRLVREELHRRGG